jgi:RNA polymerase sigma-70 factor (ECF subfamily)
MPLDEHLGEEQLMPATCHEDVRAAKWPGRLGPDSEGGFESEVLPHLPALRRLASRFAHAIADAEDLVQETMLRACGKWHQYEPGTNVRAWLMTIMRNHYINGYRAARARPTIVELDEATDLGDAAPEAGSASGEPSRALTDEGVIDAIQELPAKYRQVLLLSDVDGLPLAEIAHVLEIPVGTVKSRVHRARQRARGMLRRHAVELGVLEAEREQPQCPTPCRRIA